MGKYGPEKTSYLDTFHAVLRLSVLRNILRIYVKVGFILCQCPSKIINSAHFQKNMDEISLLEYFMIICRNNISTYIEHKGSENQLMPAVKKLKTFFGIQIQTLGVVKQYGSK